MAFEFKFPDVGEGIHEGEIVRWRVNVGDEVKEDQPLVEMETAKAVVELPSPKTGTVLAVIGKEGEIIKVGATIVVIGEKGEKWSPGETPKEAQVRAEPATASKAGPGVVGEIPTDAGGVVLPPRTPQTTRTPSNAALMLPRDRALAQNKETIDISGPVERVPFKGIRKAIADHMVSSLTTIAHVTHMDEFDASALVAKRAAKKADAEKQGIKLTYLAYIVKACVESLKQHPKLNSALDSQAQEIVQKKYYNIGIAVDTDEGLMVPVIKNADTKDILTIAKEIVELAEACRSRKITAEQLKGATFTITNIGSVGGIFATPVIPLGQAAILGVMRMQEKPIALQGKVEIRPVMHLALSFDHRILDGADAGRFVNTLMSELQKA